MFARVVIVGVGLMGGSLGLALKRHRLAERIVGVGRSPERLAVAREQGQIDEASTDVAEAVAQADLVVVGLPSGRIANCIAEVGRHCPANCVLTDLGSTKLEIAEAVDAQTGNGHFVGSHPLAGDHRAGCEFARENLFDNRVCVVTPTELSNDEAISHISNFWSAIGMTVVSMSPEEHDRLLACVSHVPHLAAAAVAAVTPEQAYPLAASGWLDTTRVAAGDVEMWRQIVGTNRAAIEEPLAKLIQKLQEYQQAIKDADDDLLATLLEQGKQVRDAVGS